MEDQGLYTQIANRYRVYNFATSFGLACIAFATAGYRTAGGRHWPTIVEPVLPAETSISRNRSPALLQGDEIAIRPTPLILSAPTIGICSHMRCITGRDSEGKYDSEYETHEDLR
jgi:hypothetical protein